jgi:hypothetical protein
MPNGDPNFDRTEEDAYFSTIADAINRFADRHNLLIEKYYHDSPSWALRFNHPKGGHVSIYVERRTDDEVGVSSVWHIDDYNAFTRSLHWRKTRPVAKSDDSLSLALAEEFSAILAVPLGAWNQVASDYKSSWGKYTKNEFEAMQYQFPDPIIDP